MMASKPLATTRLAAPVLGGLLRRLFAADYVYNSEVTTTQPVAIVGAQSRPATTDSATLPWSRATILGWAGLAIGTVLTIVIVVVAVTLP